jgi:hypothetical protein
MQYLLKMIQSETTIFVNFTNEMLTIGFGRQVWRQEGQVESTEQHSEQNECPLEQTTRGRRS